MTRRRTEGFTLVELMVGIVIVGLLATAILDLVKGQVTFTGNQYARQEVQDNSRGAMELMTSELRGVAVGQGLTYAGADSIRFRAPFVWGVLCKATTSTAQMMVDSLVWTSANAGIPSSTVGVAMITNTSGGTGTPGFGFGFATNGGKATSGDCFSGMTPGATTLPPGTVAVNLTGISTLSGTAGTPLAGQPAYLWRYVSYGDGDTTSTADRWLTRENGGTSDVATVATSSEPLAGPVIRLRFRYYDDANAEITATPLSAVDLARVRRVQVRVDMKAQNKTGAQKLTSARSSDSVLVTLRNIR